MNWVLKWSRRSKRYIKLNVRVLLTVLFSSLLVSCAEDSVPSNAVLSVSPQSHSVQIVESIDEARQCAYSPDNYMDIPLVFQLNTADGSPIGNSPIQVYADYSENTYRGFPVLGLYDDFNSNGVIDEDTEFVSGFDDDIAEAKTGRYTGSKTLLLRVNLSCGFRGEVRAIASGISTSTLVEVAGVSADSSLAPVIGKMP